MPLPADAKVLETAEGLKNTLQGIFGRHPGFRPGKSPLQSFPFSTYTSGKLTMHAAHAKGILLKGTFTPTDKAKSLSKAQHFNNVTPVIARFSSSTGIPVIPDTDANGNPRGLAIRFQLADTPRRVHTDIVSHSTPFFPAKNGEDALAFFKSIPAGTVMEWIATHDEARAFATAPKPTPASFATEKYFSVNAFRLVDAEGNGTFVRYRFAPVAGEKHLSDEEVKAKGANFLYDEISELVKKGPVEFKLLVQIAQEGDVTNDNTVHWPEEREVAELGTISLSELVENDAAEQKNIIFDPIPRVEGVEPSDDPLLEVRAGVYLLSGRERRAA